MHLLFRNRQFKKEDLKMYFLLNTAPYDAKLRAIRGLGQSCGINKENHNINNTSL